MMTLLAAMVFGVLCCCGVFALWVAEVWQHCLWADTQLNQPERRP